MIRGISEVPTESKAQLNNFIEKVIAELGVRNASPDVITRLGLKLGGKNRPVLLQYENRVRRDKVWTARSNIRFSPHFRNTYIDEDLPVEVRRQKFEERQVKRSKLAQVE